MRRHLRLRGAEPSDSWQPAVRLTVMLNAHDRLHHRSLPVEVMNRARRTGMAGATMLRATEGAVRSGPLRHQHLFRDDATVAIVVVDVREKIEGFLEELADVRSDVVVTLVEVDARRA